MEQQIMLIAILMASVTVTVQLHTRGQRELARPLQVLSVVALASAGMVWSDEDALWWAAVATFTAFVVGPVVVLRVALRGRHGAVPLAKLLPLLWWGPGGAALRDALLALVLAGRGDIDAASHSIEAAEGRPLPGVARSLLAGARAHVALHRRSWRALVELADTTGASGGAVGLLAARACAELGLPTEGLLRAERVVRSPALTRDGAALGVAELAASAAAGDLEHLERVALRPEALRVDALLPGTVAYWRGRCHLVRGEQDLAQRAFGEALAAMPATAVRSREVVERYATGDLLAVAPASLVGYERVRDRFGDLVERMAPWSRFLTGEGAIPVTWALVMVSAALLAPLYVGREDLWVALLDRYANVGSLVLHGGEWWRLLTALFLHANLFHFSFNALALVLFGGPVERMWGPFAMMAVFLISGVGGHLVSAVWHGSGARAVGASTGVYGILAVYILTFLRLPGRELRAFRMRRVALLLLLVAFDVAFSLLEERIDTAGHVGGLVFGAALGGLLLLASHLQGRDVWRPRRARGSG